MNEITPSVVKPYWSRKRELKDIIFRPPDGRDVSIWSRKRELKDFASRIEDMPTKTDLARENWKLSQQVMVGWGRGQLISQERIESMLVGEDVNVKLALISQERIERFPHAAQLSSPGCLISQERIERAWPWRSNNSVTCYWSRKRELKGSNCSTPLACSNTADLARENWKL